MSASDNFQVTAAFDKTSYNAGDTMTITLSGDDIVTQSTTVTAPAQVTVTITNPTDGSTTTISVPPANVTTVTTTSTSESVKATGATDTSGRVWTIDASGLVLTGIA